MRAVAAMFALAVAACGASGDVVNNAGVANTATTNAATPPVSSGPAPESPLVGRWADISSSCATPVEIFGNGTFRAVDGSRGHWRLESNRLTINIGARVFSFQLVSVTRDRMVVTDANNQRGESVRCP